MINNKVLCLVILCAALVVAATDSPIVGVFTQPSRDHPEPPCNGNCLCALKLLWVTVSQLCSIYCVCTMCRYLAASYVSYLESAGARVVPVNYYANNSVLDTLFDSLNGFFFVGGGADFPPSAQYIFDKTVAANKGASLSYCF